jgi:glutamyl/glutaminyl-tRNA synthetase
MSFKQDDQSDFIIIASDKIASYNFAVVIDDAFMEISHVMRGDDHLSNTPRQILLQVALGLPTPLYAHLPLVLAPDKTPLSKRHSHLSVSALREEGYLPLALLNSVARLGWAPGNDLMTLSELTEAFDTKRLSKSASLFSTNGLRNFARASIANTPSSELLLLIKNKFADIDEELLTTAIDILKHEAETTAELARLINDILSPSEPTEEAKEVLISKDSSTVIHGLIKELLDFTDIDKASWNKIVSELKDATGLRGKTLFMPIRAALTGTTKGIELDKILSLIGVEEAQQRLKKYT